jgi:hypothetical protein
MTIRTRLKAGRVGWSNNHNETLKSWPSARACAPNVAPIRSDDRLADRIVFLAFAECQPAYQIAHQVFLFQRLAVLERPRPGDGTAVALSSGIGISGKRNGQ